jgi:hypothetical protein
VSLRHQVLERIGPAAAALRGPAPHHELIGRIRRRDVVQAIGSTPRIDESNDYADPGACTDPASATDSAGKMRDAKDEIDVQMISLRLS